jgi:hypothetical protein
LAGGRRSVQGREAQSVAPVSLAGFQPPAAAAVPQDAGIYAIDGRYGTVKAWRVEINKREKHASESAKPAEGLSRRLMLAGLAIPPGIRAVLPAVAVEPDPILAAIEKHRDLSATCDPAVAISASMANDGPDFEAADALAAGKQQLLIDHADTLIRSEPTTLAGVVALMRYVTSLEEWQEPVDRRDWEEIAMVPSWHQVFLDTMARARTDQHGGVIAMDNIITFPPSRRPHSFLGNSQPTETPRQRAGRRRNPLRQHERELTPKDVLTDLFEGELLPNPEAMAEIMIQRLIDAGLVIEPAED